MTKKEKILALGKAMTVSKRRDNPEEDYTHFTDEAPEELKSLFLEHYEVRDIDYQTFKDACDIVAEIYSNDPKISSDKARDEIYEATPDTASVYTSVRLSYLNIWNEDEVSQIMREYDESSIATACAIWYERQVEQAAQIINDWVNE